MENTTTDSQYRLVSIGWSVDNKSRSTRDIEVCMIEKLPHQDGELVAGQEQDSITCETGEGNSTTFKVNLSNTITATWMGDGSNRVSAPDIRRGERVNVYQYGDTDKYFWTAYNEPGKSVRRRETVIQAYSNTEDESQNELNPDNSYYSEINTHDKVATLIRTNKSDGESFAYDMTVDPGKSEAGMADDAGNSFKIKSSEGSVQLTNAHGSKVVLDKNDIIIQCSGQIKVISGKGVFNIGGSQWTGGVTYGGGSYTYNGAVVTTATITNAGKNIGASHGHSGVETGGGSTGPVK